MATYKSATGLIATADTCDAAYAQTLHLILTSGHHTDTYQRHSPEKSVGSSEIIGYQIEITNPRDRILRNPNRQLNPIGAVARFVWMIAGSDRLEDIAYYEPKVRHYTDNDLTVPGSSYGMRLFQSRPGLNQIEGVIERLHTEVGSRRGAAVIWTPEDAVRDSNDIPCAFGLFYHLRGDALVATTIMRSNNAFILLPYNTFEFGLIAEIVATSLGVRLGSLLHYASSMHVYDNQAAAAQSVITGYESSLKDAPAIPMPDMPGMPSPLEQAYALARLEAALRHDHRLLQTQTSKELLERGVDLLHPYWLTFYRVLLVHALAQGGRIEIARDVAEVLPEYFRSGVIDQLNKISRPDARQPAGTQLTLRLDGTEEPSGQHSREIAAAFAPSIDEERERVAELEALLDGIERDMNIPVTRYEARALRQKLIVDAPVAVAARSEASPTASANDRLLLAAPEVRAALENIRRESR